MKKQAQANSISSINTTKLRDKLHSSKRSLANPYMRWRSGSRHPILMLTLMVMSILWVVGCASDRELSELDKTNDNTQEEETTTFEENTSITEDLGDQDGGPPAIDNSLALTAFEEPKEPNTVTNLPPSTSFRIRNRAFTIAISSAASPSGGREAYNNGNLKRVLVLTENSANEEDLYYRAMSLFRLLANKLQYTREERVPVRDEIIAILNELRSNAQDEILQTKATLWLAVALDLNYIDMPTKRRALRLFLEVRKNKKYANQFWNEALLYTSDLYAKAGYYPQARESLKKLAATPFSEDLVYDYVANTHISPQEAVSNGYTRLKLYVEGSHPNYR